MMYLSSNAQCMNLLINLLQASEFVWEQNNRQIAPNGAVMRTSFVGIHMYWSLDDVAKNARDFAKTTHFDPR